MNKFQYQAAYRIARLLLQCNHYPDRSDRIGKKVLRQELKRITTDPLLWLWIPTNAIQKNYSMETAYHQRRRFYIPACSREWNREINVRIFKWLLKEVYGAVNKGYFKKNVTTLR